MLRNRPDYTGISREEVRRLEAERAARAKEHRANARREYGHFAGVIRALDATHVTLERQAEGTFDLTAPVRISLKLVDTNNTAFPLAVGSTLGVLVETWYMRKRGWRINL